MYVDPNFAIKFYISMILLLMVFGFQMYVMNIIRYFDTLLGSQLSTYSINSFGCVG